MTSRKGSEPALADDPSAMGCLFDSVHLQSLALSIHVGGQLDLQAALTPTDRCTSDVSDARIAPPGVCWYANYAEPRFGGVRPRPDRLGQG
jgi:hypothetical protein